jgi:phosphohistidine phosphatase
MKSLILLRHAKSSWNDAVARDFDRPLNKRGRRAARAVGEAMRAQGLEWDRVVASPATRVVETLADLAEGYGQPIRADFDERIYLASVTTLLEVIHEADEGADRLLVVGHNPGLENVALMLTDGERRNRLRDELSTKYPTGTVAEIAFPVDCWSEVERGTGKLRKFIRPRDLDPQLGPEPEDR